jgi:hypothetical protein
MSAPLADLLGEFGLIGVGGLCPPEPYLRGTRVNQARGHTGETGFPP